MRKSLPRLNRVLSFVLILGIAFSVVSIVRALTPDPGHDYTSVSGGVVQGDIIYGSAADTFSKLAKDTNTTRYLSNTGASNNPAWAQVNMTNGVTGALPVANGGTGAVTFTSNGAILLGNTTSAVTPLADVAVGSYLRSGGVGSAPTWGSGKILLARQVLTSGTTYTPTSGTSAALLQMCGGGGGGGGATGATTPTGSVGGGGGSGAYLEKYVTFSTTAASYTIAIGAAGSAGVAANGAGGAGGSTTFACDANCSSGAVTFTAPGGTGAPAANTAGTSVLASLGGAGGVVATNGDVNMTGQPGGAAQRFSGSTGVSGFGARSQFSGGGNSVNATAAVATAGNAGGGRCSGGGGAISVGSATGVTGGAGTTGMIVISEFR